MPELTVIMPARNAESTVRVAIKSTLLALPRDAELLVWDDASDDGTNDILSELSDARVKVFRSTSPLGSGRARAELMARSDSRYVANMDADDVCLPWRWRVQLNRLAAVDVSCATPLKFRSPAYPLPARSLRLSPSMVPLALLIHNPFFHSSMTASRKSVEDAGGYTDLRVAQDYDLFLRLAAVGCDLEIMRLPVAAYRQSPAQISRSGDYRSRIKSSESLRESYSALERRAIGHYGGEADEERESLIDRGISGFPRSARNFYRRYVATYGYGPFR